MPSDVQKASAEKAEQSGKERPRMAGAAQECKQKSPLLNHALWLVVGLQLALSPELSQSEILCKRMSWIVAQTIARQLVSVVKTSL